MKWERDKLCELGKIAGDRETTGHLGARSWKETMELLPPGALSWRENYACEKKIGEREVSLLSSHSPPMITL